jgi:hypothetical protein
MKKILLILSLLVLSFSAFAQGENNTVKSGVLFDKKVFDFGNVLRENKNYTCTFIVENQTDKPLVLLSVNTSCSCLKATYSRRPLKVGQKGVITMVLEAAKMDVGVFHRVIEVHTNAGVNYMTVKGNSVEKK